MDQGYRTGQLGLRIHRGLHRNSEVVFLALSRAVTLLDQCNLFDVFPARTPLSGDPRGIHVLVIRNDGAIAVLEVKIGRCAILEIIRSRATAHPGIIPRSDITFVAHHLKKGAVDPDYTSRIRLNIAFHRHIDLQGNHRIFGIEPKVGMIL